MGGGVWSEGRGRGLCAYRRCVAGVDEKVSQRRRHRGKVGARVVWGKSMIK